VTRVDCKLNKPRQGEPCKVNLNAFAPCVKDKKFGYEEGRPCIFLKLNKIYNWIPEYYNKSDDVQDAMPDRLKEHIRNRSRLRIETNVVWVSCEGENPADIENLGNGISYYSYYGEQGFSGNNFPFMNTKGYLQPLVAVQFTTVKRE
jgi:sodium/potassium-transporting ATPase subunit beta